MLPRWATNHTGTADTNASLQNMSNLAVAVHTAKCQMVPPLGTIWPANEKFGGAVLGTRFRVKVVGFSYGV